MLEDSGARSIRYIYDFSDSWEHRLQIGAFTDAKPGDLYPRLTDISGRCPPEDVGGFPGYEEFLEAMADPKHPEHANLTEWYGGVFDPDTPQEDELRFQALKLAKRWKPKKTINWSTWGQSTAYDSSHILDTVDFAKVRYFRRCSEEASPDDEPAKLDLTTIHSLRDFSPEETDDEGNAVDPTEVITFLQKYLKLTHCDLFFADAVILVEGSVKRLFGPVAVSCRLSKPG
ncbi:hypothetical protein ROLI_011200 [Roseobacter fucihabitans]|uniref:Plasmid pRiA4b Orf3-like domain-containing protein n=1 Tax=Roseobacter fucihabitans TaxID=1537242 RepID=A0ABZ2BS35_9RHOB|nr:Plasmid pRiA4b ORF-3-like protein [Roseobacter litoralis]